MYHQEFANNAMQKMNTLPIRGSALYRGKCGLLCLLLGMALFLEGTAVGLCVIYWFPAGNEFWLTLGKYLGFSYLLTLPCVFLSLLISSVCQNMWVSLGIGVVCIFTATILPSENFALSLFPYALPFRLLFETARPERYLWAAPIEVGILLLSEAVIVRIRRTLE